MKIVKIGGNIIDNPKKLSIFLENFAEIKDNKILIHGGGTIANKFSEKLGITPKIYNGRRITDKHSLDITTMIYAGLLSKRIVANLQSLNCNAMGLSGADANIITAKKREISNIDYGFVGDVTNINVYTISKFIDIGIVPVINSIAHNNNGQLLNINADTIAAELATSLAKFYPVELLYFFDKNGVLNKKNIIEKINKYDFKKLKQLKIIKDGMIPKLDNCFKAVDNGVKSVKIAGEKYFTTNKKVYTEVINF